MKLNFGQNLIKYRKNKNLTQGQLASMLSVTPQAVSKWENGSYPDCMLLPEISRVLDVSLDVLFGLKEEGEKVNLNYELAISRLNPDMQYCCVMCIP